jgi:exopolyphosphatase / guanosine-5'-triphosphate,3'-diphosphate pyrophosphatase
MTYGATEDGGGAAVAGIIPRWEWRVFGTNYVAAEDAFSTLSPGPAQHSDEIYLFADVDCNVKIRGGLMDIKLLREVNTDGLQRWEPVLKQSFPLPRDDVATVYDALGIGTSPPDRDIASLDELLATLAESGDAVLVVRIHKRRVRYTLAGCMAELTDLQAGGRSTRTIAVESEDPSAVIRAVRGLGLDGQLNTSYSRAIAVLLEGGPPRYAVIDIGTNSVKFHIGERDADGSWRTVVDRAEVTRLGEGVSEHGTVQPEPLERTVAAIAGMVDEASRNLVRETAAVATAGLRMAGNSDEVLATIRARTGVTVEVISGEEEGRLDYLAARTALDAPEGSVVVFDTGGGSSQFTFGRGHSVAERFSVDVGAVWYTERFGLAGIVDPEVLKQAREAISADLARLDGRPRPDTLIGMGGALTNMTAVKLGLASYDPDLVHGTMLDAADIDRQIELYRSQDAESRRLTVGLQPKRAEVILAGACIVRTVMDKLGRQTLTVSDRGIRHALLRDRFGA